MRCQAGGSYAGAGLKPARPDPGGCRPAHRAKQNGATMPVEVSKSAVVFDGADGVRLFRLGTIVRGMKLELLGMRLTAKAPSCFTIARREFGLRGSKEKILADMTAIYNAAKAEQGLP